LFFKSGDLLLGVGKVELYLFYLLLSVKLFGNDILLLLNTHHVNISDCIKNFVEQLHSASLIFFK